MPQLPPSAPSGAEMDEAPAMPVPPQPLQKKHIEVVAVGLGFYDNHRKVEGDHFTVPSIDMCGSWMKCVDPKFERERQMRLKEKKKKANTAAD